MLNTILKTIAYSLPFSVMALFVSLNQMVLGHLALAHIAGWAGLMATVLFIILGLAINLEIKIKRNPTPMLGMILSIIALQLACIPQTLLVDSRGSVNYTTDGHLFGLLFSLIPLGIYLFNLIQSDDC